VAKVLSTTKRYPCAWARSPTAARSTRFIIGLVGVSQYTIRVAEVMACSTALTSRMSTNVKLSPSRAYTRSIRRWLPP